MQINVFHYEPRIFISEAFQILFPTASVIFRPFYSCEVVSASDIRKNEAQGSEHFASIMAVVLKL